MTDNDSLPRPPFPLNHPATWIATWGGAGFLRPGPGTWGTVFATPVALAIITTGGTLALAIATLFIILAGVWSTTVLQHRLGIADDGRIVIDEVAGISIALLMIPLTPWTIIAAIVLFRMLDILKPGPIGWLDRNIKGAWGVIADDLLAGFVTGLMIAGFMYVVL
ncbi:MAG: phosphatidylglycerophosphatase A [Pseudomonadota bacterium]